jgi:hypothetical protein
MVPFDTAVAGRPEVELLLCCTRSRTDHARSARIKSLLEEEIDLGICAPNSRNAGLYEDY